MADLDWILADGEDLEDALEDFKAEVEKEFSRYGLDVHDDDREEVTDG